MSALTAALFSSLLISLISLIGVFSLALNHQKLHKLIIYLLALAAGTLMADAFFHLLPESAESLGLKTSLEVAFLAFMLFFVIEKIFQWRHCHKENCHIHSFGYMNLLGDSIHNFIDGLIIAASFATDWKLGVASAIGIALHELPQEFGDFGVLIHAGFNRFKAVLLNFAVALVSLLGVVVGSFWLNDQLVNHYLLAVAAGGFLYIATSDLLPEIRAEKDLKKLISSLLVFGLGVLSIYFLA